ncbi:GTP-binding protein [Roseibacillus persicicus]|uniref:GTP-binding protein n=1 Tax=Roseibacillus persicicus TaxID=454148 RepID=UPI00398AD2E9
MNVRFYSIDKNVGRFFLIGGFLGAGKTSLIRMITLKLRHLQLEAALVTNDQGEGLLDTDSARETLSFSSTHSASDNDYLCDNIDTKEISGDEKTPQESPPPPLVSEITGGCFCCRLEELVGTIETLSQESRPDVIVAEPVGSCTDLMATVIRPLEQIYKTPLTLAPLSVVLDARRALAALGGKRNKRDFHRDVGYIYRKQLEEAEWLVVNKCDLMTAEDLADLERRLARSFPGKRTFYLSAKTGEGLDEWLEALLTHQTGSGAEMEVDYERYAEGEALLGWVNSEALCYASGEIDWNQWLSEAAQTIANRLDEAGHEVGHFKMSVEANGQRYRVHQVMSDEEVVTVQRAQPNQEPDATPRLLVNLRAEGDAKRLETIVLQSFAESNSVDVDFLNQAAFQPGKPVPVHRLASV